MGLASARTQAVQGLQAQSVAIGDASKNVANASTVGYKATRVNFSTLVTGSSSGGGDASGGVNASVQQQAGSQGLIEATGKASDLAISGSGFMAVQDTGGNLLLTRAGSFDTNSTGQLVNANGFSLLGWPLDNDGRRPGETGNTNTTAAESVESLEVVDINSASGTASATSTVSVGMNLNAGQATYQGATSTISFNTASNAALSQSDIVAPKGNMMPGDLLTFTSSSITSTFDYGGFARSADLSVASVFGAAASGTTFSTSATAPVLAENDKFTITTVSSGTVTFTFTQSAPDTASGQFNSLDSLATAINSSAGLTARVEGTELFISSTDANEAITFADVSSSNLDKELGFGSVLASTTNKRWNTLQGLATLVNLESQLGATVISPAASATLEIYSSDPLQTLIVTKTHQTAVVDLQSDENGVNGADDIIVPINGHTSMEKGTSTITVTDGTNTGTFTYGGFGESKAISSSAQVFGASTATAAFTASGGLADDDTLTFSDGINSVVALFDLAGTNAGATEFNTLTTLASVVNANANFSARVYNDRLYVSSTALPDNALTVTAGVGTLTGVQMAAAFGGDFTDGGAQVANIVAAAGGAVDRFATLTRLDSLIDGVTNFTGTLTTGTNSSISASTDDSAQITIGGSSNAQLLKDLGLASGDVGDQAFTEMGLTGTTSGLVPLTSTTATVPVSYDPTDATKNMAGGNVSAHFSRNIRVFDSLGTGHDFRLAFIKIGTNKWGIEFYSLTPSEITGRTDGQVVNGTVEFNGDGSLKSVTAALTTAIPITWTTGASSSSITFSLGTAGQPAGTVGASVIGLTDGIRQFDSSYNVEFVEQNGVAAGLFSGIEVQNDGTVNARFSNGEVKAIYQLPLITVANENGLVEQTGNVWAASSTSGEVNLKVSGLGGTGEYVAGSLESSTSDIAEELTRTIGIQAAYNANATVISKASDMEDELNRRL